jgi:hypothetical protein
LFKTLEGVMQGQQQSVLGNGLKLLGEVMVPGAAEMLEGRLGSGVAHNLIAGAATLAFAPVSPLLAGVTVLAVKLNSYSRSVSGRGLIDTLGSAVRSGNGGSETGADTATTPASRTARSTGTTSP